ncbi:MAG: class I SAM-dependent methyltransferase, partial [Pyrinomonadaceae bacterium]
YGIDTWRGDDHAGTYDETVYEEYSRYHDEHYSSFSRLVRSTFDEALHYFPDRSIDLLHIDGRHSYEDVKHDFESWLPKLSDRAIVLFHDINVREREFGAWKFFLELSQQYSGDTFSFIHSHGLGVLIIGDKASAILKRLGHLEGEDVTFVRLVFSTFGKFVKSQVIESRLRSKVEELESTVKQAVSAVENAEKLRTESVIAYEEQIRSAEMERREVEIDSYKTESRLRSKVEKLESAVRQAVSAAETAEKLRTGSVIAYEEQIRSVEMDLQEKDRLLETLIRSRSMRLTRPLRYLVNNIRHWRH